MLLKGWPHSQGEKTEHISSGRRDAKHGWSEELGCYSCLPFLISHFFCFRPLLFLSLLHSQLNANPFPHTCSLFPLSKSPIPDPNITASQQYQEGVNRGDGPQSQPTVLSQGWCWCWLCQHSWPSSQAVANLWCQVASLEQLSWGSF